MSYTKHLSDKFILKTGGSVNQSGDYEKIINLSCFFYQVALLNSSGEINFRAELTIMNLDEEDEKNEYHLVNYFFFLK